MHDAKVILITGASRGIGRRLAIEGAREGYAVVINYVANEAAAQDVVREIVIAGGRAAAVRADVGVPGDVDALVAATLERFGRVDVLVNNAGGGPVTPLPDLDANGFEQVMRLNLLSAFLMSQAVIPHMSPYGGRLIFMSSLTARTGGLVSAAYAASKAGLEGLMHYYAAALLPHRITANAIAPALIASDMTDGMALPSTDQLPFGRLGRPEEVWPVVQAMLDTEYMTGQTIHLNAGRYMT